MTKAEQYAKQRAAVNARTVAVAKEQRDAIQAIEAERPRLAIVNLEIDQDLHGVSGDDYGLRRAREILCDVDDAGDLRLTTKTVRAGSVRTRLIPWLIEHFGAPPKKGRR